MGRYLAPIKFSSLEIPLNKGGLGLFNLKQWNKTAFAKHIDTLFNYPDSLWAKWSEMNVIKGKNLWNMNKPQKLSWTWQCIFKLKEYVLPLIQMNTDPIYRVNFWDDPWLDKGYIIRRKLSYNEVIQTGIHLSTKVMDVLYTFQGVGKYSSNQRVQIIWDKIRNFTLLHSTSARIIWEEKKAAYKIDEAYEYMQRNSDIPAWTWWKSVWTTDSSMRENLLLWKVLKRAILTKVKLAIMGINMDVLCPFCSEYVETAEHLFFECELIMQIWTDTMVSIDGNSPSLDNIVEWDRI